MRVLRSAIPAALLAACAGPAPGDTGAAVEIGPPPPYTADQIRQSHPDGTLLRMRMRLADGTESITRTLFHDADAKGVSITTGTEPPGGGAPAETETVRASWPELRDHAAFPPALTTRRPARCRVPAGRYDCWLYTVRPPEGSAGAVSHFWFAHDKPGPPVLLTREQGGREVLRMELLEYRRGG